MEAEHELSSTPNHCSKIAVILATSYKIFKVFTVYYRPGTSLPVDFYESSINEWGGKFQSQNGICRAFGFL